MKFQAAFMFLLASGASAFSPKPFSTRKSGLVVPSDEKSPESSGLWTPPKMVAGGAERAYGQEYYEGKSLAVQIPDCGPRDETDSFLTTFSCCNDLYYSVISP